LVFGLLGDAARRQTGCIFFKKLRVIRDGIPVPICKNLKPLVDRYFQRKNGGTEMPSQITFLLFSNRPLFLPFPGIFKQNYDDNFPARKINIQL
jgi:hypothetical protein